MWRKAITSFEFFKSSEVAYLLRVLLDRLNLHPDSPQLRIIASSASLESGNDGLDYLEGFFGRNRERFSIVEGATSSPNPSSIQTFRTFAPAFRGFGRSVQNDSDELAVPAKTLADAIGIAEE